MMFWSRDLVDADTAAWVDNGFRWLVETLGPNVYFDETRLVLPTREFFQSPGGTSHETAQSIFDEVRALMGMEDWPCQLVRQDHDPDPVLTPTLMVSGVEQMPAGTFEAAADQIQITYSPDLMRQPISFLNVLSHELAHYLLADLVDEAPGGEEAHEIMTDLAAIYAGFGVIQLEGGMIATGFQDTFAQGWQIGNHGYLSSEVRAYALALFLRSKKITPETALAHLSSDKVRLVRRALKMLDRMPERVVAIRRLDPGATPSGAGG